MAGRFSSAGGRLPLRHGVGGFTTKLVHSLKAKTEKRKQRHHDHDVQTITNKPIFLGVYVTYVLFRRVRDGAENPTVGVGVHQALAAPPTHHKGVSSFHCLFGG